ncbi:MAG TPA: class I SAM-dependent methyltransferase [Polyangiaceae bacterium]
MSRELACRSCRGTRLENLLTLGDVPLANSLLAEDALDRPEPVFPLELVFCAECALVQITETVPPEKLFSEYLYFSSYSDTMLASARSLAERLTTTRRLSRDSLVVEVASNDGYLLQFYKAGGVPVLGIEPAANIARLAETERGIPTLVEFFGRSVGERLKRDGRRADVIHANNVLAHVADLNGFIAGLRAAVKDDGVVVIEVPYVREMIERCEFDTIYHEHLCYFSLVALERLFARHDLAAVDVELLPIHGGSLRLFVAPAPSAAAPSQALSSLRAEEARWGAEKLNRYNDFAEHVVRLRAALKTLLGDIKSRGQRIAAYGAAAKGATLLNYAAIGRETIDFVADRSPHKQGRYMPGVRLPIVDPRKLVESMPEYVLLLAWNLADEIVAQQAEYRARGGRFIVPVPEPRVV